MLLPRIKSTVLFNNAILGGGSGIPGDVSADYFEAQGATQPWYAGSTQYNACHHNGKTYVVWETYDRVGDKRFTQIRAYTHSSGQWGRVYTVGPPSNVEDDDHGVPSIAVNADGRICVAWGNHDGNFHFATSTNVGDESHWTVLMNGLVGRYTYPHLVLVGTTMYCLLRLDTQPTVEFTNGAKYLVYRPITFVGATATVGSQVKIADFGDDSRWYQGNAILDNGRICQVAARADYNDTFRRDVYYYEIDITNQRLQQFDGGTNNFPVSATDMNTNYRVRQTTAPAVLGVPSFEIGDDDRTHIVFGEGETSMQLYHIIGESGVFASPDPLNVISDTSLLADGPRILHESGSQLGMYYPVDPSALYTRGGRIARRVYDGSDWGPHTVVMSNDESRWPLGQIGVVFNAHADARVIFTEISETDADSGATPWKRGFVLGDSGFLPHSRATASSPASFAAEGAWYDPSDGSTLWSDTARTTPAVVDGPVRAIDDKSGNGHHLILEGSEPGTWRQDDGASWIDIGDEFSPTTSYAVTGVTLVADNAYWVCGGFRDWEDDSGATSNTLIALDEGSGSDRIFSIARQNDSSGLEGQVQFVPFSNTGSGASFTSAADGVRANDDLTFGLHVNGTAATGYWNGVQAGTATVATVPDTGASRVRLGGNATLTANSYLTGRFYGAIIRAGNIDLTTRQADMAYIQSNMPL